MATEAEIKEFSQYGYMPTEWVCILFIVLFSISSILHLGQSIRTKMWFLFPTAVLCGIGEIIGWAGRFWSTQTWAASGDNPFLMQISSTIIAPTPLVAANFIILGMLIKYLGSQYSRLSPRMYSIIFCSVDIVALVVQAYGGAVASSNSDDDSSSVRGGHIMLAGIIIQLVSITFYVALAVEFLFRYTKDSPARQATNANTIRGPVETRIKYMVFGLSLSTLCLFIRAVYRTIELSDGWHGRIIQTEVYFNVLDGGMVTLAIYSLNIFHPGFLLSHAQPQKEYEGESLRMMARDQSNATLADAGWRPSKDMV